MTSEAGLSEHHPMITTDRDTGNAYYMSGRQYPTGDVEIVAIQLDSDDSLRRGGGARRKNDDKSAMDDVTLNKSISRARTTVRRRLLAMSADRMLTLTFRENVTDIDVAWQRFKYFVRLMRHRYRDRWAYVAVPEYQKRGAVHFHLAVTGYYHVNTIRRLWLRAVGQFGGNIDITSPKKFGKNSWNPKRIAVYLSKYITKSETVDFNRRRYSSGGDIQIPEPVKGWLALGMPVIKVMRETVESMTRKPVSMIWESDGYFGITYLST